MADGLPAATAADAITAAYARGEGDEFVQPTVLAAGDTDQARRCASSTSTSGPIVRGS